MPQDRSSKLPPQVEDGDKMDAAAQKNDGMESFNELERRVKITFNTRFQSSLRLDVRQKASYFTISILTLFVIVLSLVPNIFVLSNAASQSLLALTIINSVFIIITTFLEASGNFALKGEQLHRSARKIQAVFNKMILLKSCERRDKSKIEALQKEYQDALDDCPFNHENMDYFGTTLKKPELIGKNYTG